MDRDAPSGPEWEEYSFTGLSLQPQEMITAGKHVACASVFASVDPPRVPGLSIVRVDLEASVLNIKRPVASAFLLPPFQGPCISVTGLPSTSFHVSVSGNAGRQAGRVSLTTRDCCSAFSVNVPENLLDFPTGPTEDIRNALNFNRPPMPWGVTKGQYWSFNTTQQTQVVEFDFAASFGRGCRPTHLRANAMGNNASVTVIPLVGLPRAYNVPNGGNSTLETYFPGTSVARGMTWVNIRTLLIEGVR